MPSTSSGSQFTWTCPVCGRNVPYAVPACRCGHLQDGFVEPDFPSEADTRPVPSHTENPPRTSVPGGILKISHDDLAAVAGGVGLSPELVDRLWNALCARGAGRRLFDGEHVAYYLGALIVIAAMGFFMALAWDAIGGFGLALFAG